MLPVLAYSMMIFVCTAFAVAEVPEHFLITSDEVLVAMQRDQLPIEGAQVALVAKVNTLSTHPALKITAISAVDAHNARIKVTCQVHSECLPFYASIHWPDMPGLASAQTIAASFAGSSKDHGPVAAGSGEQTGNMRAGAHATLVIDDQRIHIRMAVVCLQAGNVGDKVKVTTLNRRQAYEAVILNGAELKGSL